MTSTLFKRHAHSIGITRRELLQVGYSGLLGIGLPSLLGQRAVAADAGQIHGGASRQPKSIIVVFLTGAPSHLDMFDMKPEAPAEIRGEFQPIATRVPRPPRLRAPAATGRSRGQVRRVGMTSGKAGKRTRNASEVIVS